MPMRKTTARMSRLDTAAHYRAACPLAAAVVCRPGAFPRPTVSMPITRRHLLALAGLTASAGAAGLAGVGLHWWQQPPQAPYAVLSADEAAFLLALGGALFPATRQIPLSGAELQLDRFMDDVLGGYPQMPRDLLRVLMHALDASCLPGHLASFSALDLETRTAVIEVWSHHDRLEVRSAFLGLVVLLGMGWSTHPEVVPTMAPMFLCGYGR